MVYKIGKKNEHKHSEEIRHNKCEKGIMRENQVSPESGNSARYPKRCAEKACKWWGTLQPLEDLGLSKG